MAKQEGAHASQPARRHHTGLMAVLVILLLIAAAGKLALYWKKQSRKAGYGMEK